MATIVNDEIVRLQTARNTIRTKLVDLGLAESTALLDVCATAIDGIANRGSVSANVKEGETYTIPKGYHNGSGTVSGVSGGGNYSLQSKVITPTKAQTNVVPDSGYYGLSDVTVKAIPEAYQDVTSVTATADDVLANKIIVTSSGTVTAGTMVDNGAVSQSLSTTTPSYTIPKGFHSGSGKVSITLETKTVTPTETSQEVVPSTGKVLSKVTVNPIPAKYADLTNATATASSVLEGDKIAVLTKDVDGTVTGTEIVTGTMTNNGTLSATIDGTTTTDYTLVAGYYTGGKISLDDTIYQALAAI